MHGRPRPGVTTQAPGPVGRVALYSHDTQGLGHIRRNIALAAALVADDPRTNVLLLTGAPEATALPLPERTEVVTLPTLTKAADGMYASRVLDAPLEDVLAMRTSVVLGALMAFRPDLLIVDKVARGVHGELDVVLRRLRAELPGTKVVLGLRDILDDRSTATAQWFGDGSDRAVCELYDEVWVYGDPGVYDPVQEYGFSAGAARRAVHTGYLGRGRSTGTRTRTRAEARVELPTQPYVLCLVGGGQDGSELARDFMLAPHPAGVQAVAVSGPYMSAGSRRLLRDIARTRPGVRLLEFVPDAVDFVVGARAVVSMAGYNSVCEVLAAGRPALLVPRVRPRLEQQVRARRLADLGLVDMLEPEEATPEAIGAWVHEVCGEDVPARQGYPVDLDGLTVVPRLARALVASGPRGGLAVRDERPVTTREDLRVSA